MSEEEYAVLEARERTPSSAPSRALLGVRRHGGRRAAGGEAPGGDGAMRLQQIRRLCNRLLLGEFEAGGGDDGARREGE